MRRREALALLAAAVAPGQAGMPVRTGQAGMPVPTGEEMERQNLRQLLALRRVYVDRLGNGSAAGQLRDMVMAALHRARLFVVTEDEERADAYIRGSAEDLIFTETHSSRDGVQVRGRASASSREAGRAEAASAGVGIEETDDRYARERKHEAVAALRLVSRDGDVLWSTTQESLGAKYKGSAADVADKVAKELAAVWARARKTARGP